MRRVACGSCSSTELEQFLDLGKTPLADYFPADPDEELDWYPLQLAVCNACKLVQLTEIVDDDILWKNEYGFYTGASAPLRGYFDSYAQWVVNRFGDLARRKTVEIAANDGTLLKALRDNTVPEDSLLGIDPAVGPVQVAVDAGIPMNLELFTEATARRIVTFEGQAGVVIANNVIAHVTDLNDFIAGIRTLLAPDGVAIIEFQYVGDLLAGNMFDHVYHEHRFFFSLSSLDLALRRHGLGISEWETTPQQGGSRRVVVRHMNGNGMWDIVQDRMQVRSIGELWLREWCTYESFQGRVERVKNRLWEIIDPLLESGDTIAGYGASAKATTLLAFCGLSATDIAFMEDTTPHKIGKYMPVGRIPIFNPGFEDVTTYLVTAWNYLPQIMAKEAEFMRSGGKLIAPIPLPVMYG